MKKLTFLLAASFISLISLAQTTCPHWEQAGDEIYNKNLGVVVLTARTGTTGTQRLCLRPLSTQNGAAMIIGEPNTGTGGYTSITMATSAYQDGYGYLQTIKASGSAYGVLSLNPVGGSVAIGTSSVTGAEYKLVVEGKIGAREIKVMTAPWPDYVFNNTYPRMTLASLEAFIQQHKHLPNIPSAAEVEKEGVALGEMSAKLLEKIEELTLHVIELNKKVEALEKKNQELEAKKTEKTEE